MVGGGGGLDYLQDRAKGSVLYGFKGGPAGIMKCKYVELNADYIYPYRNQVKFSSFQVFLCECGMVSNCKLDRCFCKNISIGNC